MSAFVALVCVAGVTGVLNLQHFLLYKQYSDIYFCKGTQAEEWYTCAVSLWKYSVEN